jgi:hypothetical protein
MQQQPVSDPRPFIQLEVRPGSRGSPALRMLAEALLSAAREELAWAEEESALLAEAGSPLTEEIGQTPGFQATQPATPQAA